MLNRCFKGEISNQQLNETAEYELIQRFGCEDYELPQSIFAEVKKTDKRKKQLELEKKEKKHVDELIKNPTSIAKTYSSEKREVAKARKAYSFYH